MGRPFVRSWIEVLPSVRFGGSPSTEEGLAVHYIPNIPRSLCLFAICAPQECKRSTQGWFLVVGVQKWFVWASTSFGGEYTFPIAQC